MLIQSTSTKFNRRAVSLNVGKKFMKSIELIEKVDVTSGMLN